MKKLLVFVIAAITMMAMLLTGCGGGEKKADKAAVKTLKVACEPSFAPFEFQKKGSNEITGFDIDLIKAVGAKAGYKVEIMNMGFDALIPAIGTGNIDVAASGMTITEERKKAVSFSDPYYTSGLIILVNKDNNEIKSIKDLEGKKIACQIGTTGEKKSRSVKGAKVTAFNTNVEATMELKNKGVDAVINDAPVVGYYLAQGGNATAKTVGEVMEAEQYGFAVKKDSKLAGELSQALAELKKNGEYDKIYKTWFGEAKK